MVIWLASYPRSGNSLFRIALKQLGYAKTYSLHDDQALHQLRIADLVGHENLPDRSITEMNDDKALYFIKTHNYPTDDNYPAICIIRDGRDVAISYANYLKNVEGKGENYDSILTRLVEGGGPFGSWSTHVMKWMNRKPKPVLVRYEELILDPLKVVKKVLKQLGVSDIGTNYDTEKFPDFYSMRMASPDFFRSGKTGQWKQSMPPELKRIFSWIHCSVLDEFDYEASVKNENCLHDLPEITLSDMAVEFKKIDPILDGICMPPYYGSNRHDDFNVLMSIAVNLQPKNIFEFGTGRGNTIANLCQYTNADITTLNALPENTSGMMRTFDLTVDQIGGVYKTYGYTDRINQILSDSLNVNLIEYIGDNLYDMVIIDACHDYEYVLNDFFKINNFISPNGLVLFHDCHPTAENHTKEVWNACKFLRLAGFDIKHIDGTWWGIWFNNAESSKVDHSIEVLIDHLLLVNKDVVRLMKNNKKLNDQANSLNTKLDRIRKIPGYIYISKFFSKLGI